MEALSAEIDKIIADNLPRDYRAPIQLDMFKHTLNVHSDSMIFSKVPMAQVVNLETDNEDELKKSVKASLKI
jgi:hypothetical protein